MSKDSERQAFLDRLQENEDDEQTRLVYADWLDEQGEVEEANRQRKWVGAKQWMLELCTNNNRRECPECHGTGVSEDPTKNFQRSFFPNPTQAYCRSCYGNGIIQEEDYLLDYPNLMAVANEAADDNSWEFSCRNNERMCDELRSNSGTFWVNWSILTGRSLPPDLEDRYGFSCGC